MYQIYDMHEFCSGVRQSFLLLAQEQSEVVDMCNIRPPPQIAWIADPDNLRFDLPPRADSGMEDVRAKRAQKRKKLATAFWIYGSVSPGGLAIPHTIDSR